MISRRPSALILAAALATALLACSRKAPPIEVAPEAPGARASASLPPIEISPLIRTAATASPYDRPYFIVSIPGVLTVTSPNLDVQSHGVGLEPWQATFLLTNETMTPLSVRVSDLVLSPSNPELAPDNRVQAVIVKAASAEGVRPTIEGEVVTFTVPPRRQIEVNIDGDFTQDLRVFYSVSYHHEATFSVGEARVTGRGYPMYFRHLL